VVSIDLSTFGSRLASVLEGALAAVSRPVGGSLEPPGRANTAGLIVGDRCDRFPLPAVWPSGWATVDRLGSEEENQR
jgi:hypothetical protein